MLHQCQREAVYTFGRPHSEKGKLVRVVYWRKPQYFSQLKLPAKSLFHISSKAV